MGCMFCLEWVGIKFDMVILGKVIFGGMYFVSVVFSWKDVMFVVEFGIYGFMYGGNFFGCVVFICVFEIMQEEDFIVKVEKLGNIFCDGLKVLNNFIIKIIRGKGFLNVVVIDEFVVNGCMVWDFCIFLKGKGFLVCNLILFLMYIIIYIFVQVKLIYGDIICFVLFLVIIEVEICKGLSIIVEVVKELFNVEKFKGY